MLRRLIDNRAWKLAVARILAVHPDVLELDRALTTGIEDDPIRRALVTALVTALVHLARELRVPTVSDGVETEHEALTLRALGVQFGQGYLFARPAPALELVSALSSTAGDGG